MIATLDYSEEDNGDAALLTVVDLEPPIVTITGEASVVLMQVNAHLPSSSSDKRTHPHIGALSPCSDPSPSPSSLAAGRV
jgi:hypothetical protein